MTRPDIRAVRANWEGLCSHVNNMERCLLQLCAHPDTNAVQLTEAINKYRATLQRMQEMLLELQTKLPQRLPPFGTPWKFDSISGRGWRVKRGAE